MIDCVTSLPGGEMNTLLHFNIKFMLYIQSKSRIQNVAMVVSTNHVNTVDGKLYVKGFTILLKPAD